MAPCRCTSSHPAHGLIDLVRRMGGKPRAGREAAQDRFGIGRRRRPRCGPRWRHQGPGAAARTHRLHRRNQHGSDCGRALCHGHVGGRTRTRARQRRLERHREACAAGVGTLLLWRERPWFRCPRCPRCWQRVAVLYGADKRFLCRHCYRLLPARSSASMTLSAGRIASVSGGEGCTINNGRIVDSTTSRRPWPLPLRMACLAFPQGSSSCTVQQLAAEVFHLRAKHRPSHEQPSRSTGTSGHLIVTKRMICSIHVSVLAESKLCAAAYKV